MGEVVNCKQTELEDLYINKNYVESNFLISAKYKSSLLELKLLALSLSQIKVDGNRIYAEIEAKSAKNALECTSNTFYEKLKKTAKSLTGKTIGMNDNVNKEFSYIAVVTSAKYKNGVFTVDFNPSLQNYLIDLKNNFTKLKLPIMLNFKTIYGFKLYQVLKSKMYISNTTTISIAELKFIFGIADPLDSTAIKILEGQSVPDYDKAIEHVDCGSYKTFAMFKKLVIDKAVEDINTTSELNVEYNIIKSGRGGKAHAITFIITEKAKEEEEAVVVEEKTEVNKQSIMLMTFSLIEENINLDDCKAICEAADYDYTKIENAYKVMKNQNTDIKNVVGWLITAINKDYKNIKSPKKNSFNDFEQNDYDFDKLEEILVSN